ncbi:hypothetical protein SeLEV6574_g05128 [Synchytrium endobioticum]|uniref:Uncharacterized protein n=1 Tax=Synchytrium endobioticum TaxID=286115 RepID=A0A507CWS2_9FUNG|nr:hypothetical protein SeLEV6574_g05128 [Synchytrium endobioticum]
MGSRKYINAYKNLSSRIVRCTTNQATDQASANTGKPSSTESQYLPVHQPPRSTGDIVNLTFETIRTQTLNLKTIQGANGESSVIAMMSVKTPAKMSNNKPKNPSSTVTSWTQLSSEVGQELSR